MMTARGSGPAPCGGTASRTGAGATAALGCGSLAMAALAVAAINRALA
jgi:hypothetical protein